MSQRIAQTISRIIHSGEELVWAPAAGARTPAILAAAAAQLDKPIVHGRTNSAHLWWDKLRTSIEETKESLAGFYMLRHLGATEYGSRRGISIGQVKRWLGHSPTSRVADQYMKPVSPEDKTIVEWVRNALKRDRIR